MRTIEIEEAVARMFDTRKNIIVPNISWGAGFNECDLLVVNMKGHATEVEIKISKSDLKRDSKKNHNHNINKTSMLYFAMPNILCNTCADLVPEHAGIISCRQSGDLIFATIVRPAKANYDNKLSDSEIINIGRLGCMRIWNLKRKLINIHNKQTLTVTDAAYNN